MKVKDSKTCVSPWVGLMIITAICIVMSLAVFVQFGGLNKKKAVHGMSKNFKNNEQGNFSQAAYSPAVVTVKKISF
ncbi:MAG: hypothetical protein HQL29_03395 [Candidatus Omnitrophica bacterium]|nr:hypothetical protein [Candidatus Omnitrophota bacterium]